MEIDTRASTAGSGQDSEVLVEIAHLKSYENMGKAEVSYVLRELTITIIRIPVAGYVRGRMQVQRHNL